MAESPPTDADHACGALLGLACGDALGTSVELAPRGSFEPLTDMVGAGPFGLRPSEWTDDTSMALCLAESLLERGGFDPPDQMERYVRWWREGHLSSTGRCFDIGGTVCAALERFASTGEPFAGSTDPYAAGNGSLMRLAPVALFYAPDVASAVHHAGESSRTTHGAREAVDACRLQALLLVRALAGTGREAMLDGARAELEELTGQPLAPKIAALAEGTWRGRSEDELRGTDPSP